MEKQTSLRKVKIGAGKYTLVYALIVFIAAFVTWAFTIVFFPVFFNDSAFSNELFKAMSFVSAFFVIILIPSVLFLFGYFNKKLQLGYLKGRIEDEKSKIRHNKHSIERNIKETQERITRGITENNLNHESTDLSNQKFISQIKEYHEKINNDSKNKILADTTTHEEILIGLQEALRLFK